MADTDAVTFTSFTPSATVNAYLAAADPSLNPVGTAVGTATADATGKVTFNALPVTQRLFVTDGTVRRFAYLPPLTPLGNASQGPPGPQGPPGASTPSNPGRVDLTIGNLGAGKTLTLTTADDQSQVDVPITLTADGVLTVAGIQTVTRCSLRLTVLQDAVGNHGLDILNAFNGQQVSVNVNPAPNPVGQPPVGTLVSCYTFDSATLNVADPPTTAAGGGIANPTITGTPGAPNVLTAHPAANLTSVSYQWLRDGAAIVGQTASTYTQVSGDAGHQITVQVTGTPFGVSDPVLVPSTDETFVATANQTTGTGTALRVNRPTGAADGDILYALITSVTGTTLTVTVPATTGGTDWAPVGTGRWTNSGGNFVQFLYWKRLAGGDATTQWSFTGSASSTYRSRTVAIRNATATGDPNEQVTQANGTFNTTVTWPSLTPAGQGRMAMAAVSFPGSTGITWPTVSPPILDPSGNDYGKFAYRFLGTSSSATGAQAGTASATVQKSVVAWFVKPLP